MTPKAKKRKKDKCKDKEISTSLSVRTQWDSNDQKYFKAYNGFTFPPTRFVDEKLVRKLGLWDDVVTLFENMGCKKLPYLRYETHHKQVAEFLATVNLSYENAKEPKASEGIVSFIVNKKFYQLNISDICDVFEFGKGERVDIPSLKKSSEFWDLIASGEYVSHTAKQTLIRNPVMRFAAKLLSNTMFARVETGSVRECELWILFQGVKHLMRDERGQGYPPGHRVNFGVALVKEFIGFRQRALSTTKKEIHIGGMITPILEYVGVALTDEVRLRGRSLDIVYLQNIRFLVTGKLIYQFEDKSENSFYCLLPQQHITSLLGKDNLEFLPDISFLCIRRDATRQPPFPPQRQPLQQPPQPLSPSDDGPNRENETQARSQPLLPADSSEFRLIPSLEDPSEQDYHKWMMDAAKKNNDMLHRIWGALHQIKIPFNSACFRGDHVSEEEDNDEAAEENNDEAAEEDDDEAAEEAAST